MYIYMCCGGGVMTMGNIAPRVEIKPTSLALWASVLIITPARFLMSSLYPHLLAYVGPCMTGQCRLLRCKPCKWFMSSVMGGDENGKECT